MFILSLFSFVLWILLIFCRGRFWQRGPILYPVNNISDTQSFPDVYIVIPARDEAETIQDIVASLLQQDYQGRYFITVVDDASTDGTGTIIQQYKQTLTLEQQEKVTVISSRPRPEGWSGKLWALSNGIDYLQQHYVLENSYVFFTDADIVHEPQHLTTLVHKSVNDQLDQVSEMVELRCQSFWERAFIPAFVYFFGMLYPFSKVNNPTSKIAAGAGGTVLLRYNALMRIGGIQSLKNALIDDVTLASLVKKSGGSIYLGHSCLARSLRQYTGIDDIWYMITRTAYVQLRYSLAFLLLTIVLMLAMWLVPITTFYFADGIAMQCAAAAYVMSTISFIPTLSRFNMSFLWIFLLPFISLFYLVATIGSAVNFYRGVGMMWKGRAYTAPAITMENKELQLTLDHIDHVKGDKHIIEHKDN